MWTPDARRFAGAAAGAAVPGLAAAGAWWLGIEFVAGVATAGTPIGLVVGWSLGPRAATPGKAISTWLIAAVSAVGVAIAGVVILGLADLVSGGTTGFTSAGAAVVYLLPLVVVYAFAFGLPVTAPVTALWSAIVRLMVTRPRLGWAVVLVMGITAAAMGGAALALGPALDARLGADLRRSGSPPIALALSRTEVRWTVRNCAAWPYTVTVENAPLLRSPDRQDWVAAPAAVSRGTTVVEPGWRLIVEPAVGAPLPTAYLGQHDVLDDVPGDVVEVEVGVGETGQWSVGVAADGRRISSTMPECNRSG